MNDITFLIGYKRLYFTVISLIILLHNIKHHKLVLNNETNDNFAIKHHQMHKLTIIVLCNNKITQPFIKWKLVSTSAVN